MLFLCSCVADAFTETECTAYDIGGNGAEMVSVLEKDVKGRVVQRQISNRLRSRFEMVTCASLFRFDSAEQFRSLVRGQTRRECCSSVSHFVIS